MQILVPQLKPESRILEGLRRQSVKLRRSGAESMNWNPACPYCICPRRRKVPKNVSLINKSTLCAKRSGKCRASPSRFGKNSTRHSASPVTNFYRPGSLRMPWLGLSNMHLEQPPEHSLFLYRAIANYADSKKRSFIDFGNPKVIEKL